MIESNTAMVNRFIGKQLARAYRRGQVERHRRSTSPIHSTSTLGTLILSAIVFLLLFACSPSTERQIVLPTTDVVALRPSWAVAVSAYVRIRTEPDTESPIAGHLRAGDVARVLQIGLSWFADGDDRYRWIYLSFDQYTGWVVERDLVLFDAEARARNAAAAYRSGRPGASDD